MSKHIIKVADRYMEYSTIVDAPVTAPMTLEEFTAYYKAEYGRAEMRDLPYRLRRVDEVGTSSLLDTCWHETIAGNRAGEPDQRSLSPEEFEAWVKSVS